MGSSRPYREQTCKGKGLETKAQNGMHVWLLSLAHDTDFMTDKNDEYSTISSLSLLVNQI